MLHHARGEMEKMSETLWHKRNEDGEVVFSWEEMLEIGLEGPKTSFRIEI